MHGKGEPKADDRHSKVTPGVELFHSWIASRAQSRSMPCGERAFAASSERVYLEMWKAFAVYCHAQHKSVTELAPPDLEAFLASRATAGQRCQRPLAPRYAWRMLHLIDAILRSHAEQRGVPPNLAAHLLLQTPAFRGVNAVAEDSPPRCLSADERQQLIAYLQQAMATRSGRQAGDWKKARDCAAVSLMLGAGLTPGEIRRLHLPRPEPYAWPAAALQIRTDEAAGLVRETRVESWAQEILDAWLPMRRARAPHGGHLFPATWAGKAWSHTGSQQACSALLQGAGLQNAAGGLYRLRHTYALQQLRAGTSENTVARWLGFRDPESIAQYRPLLMPATLPANAATTEQL